MYIESSMSKNSRIFKSRNSIDECQNRFRAAQDSKIGHERYRNENYEEYLSQCRRHIKIGTKEYIQQEKKIPKQPNNTSPYSDFVIEKFIAIYKLGKKVDDNYIYYIEKQISTLFNDVIFNNKTNGFDFYKSQISARLDNFISVEFKILYNYQPYKKIFLKDAVFSSYIILTITEIIIEHSSNSNHYLESLSTMFLFDEQKNLRCFLYDKYTCLKEISFLNAFTDLIIKNGR